MFTKGETVRCVVDYDLFDFNINGQEGCYVKHSEANDKHIIYFPCNEEWAELPYKSFELVNKPGYISVKCKRFINRIRGLNSTEEHAA
jgi:hypothetical protein